MLTPFSPEMLGLPELVPLSLPRDASLSGLSSSISPPPPFFLRCCCEPKGGHLVWGDLCVCLSSEEDVACGPSASLLPGLANLDSAPLPTEGCSPFMFPLQQQFWVAEIFLLAL